MIFKKSDSKIPCADPERFVRGGPALTIFFLIDEGSENQKKNGLSWARQQNAIKMAFRWHADHGQTLNASLIAL